MITLSKTSLLQDLCQVHAPSGHEVAMKDFVLDYINKEKANWHMQPDIIHGPDFQDCIILSFGKPRTAVFAHMDSIGFTVRYDNKLVRIGGPKAENGFLLKGQDSHGKIETRLAVDEEENTLYVDLRRPIDSGTELVFAPEFIEDDTHVQCCYMDNRLGVWSALRLCETVENGLIVFSCWEEHGGGSVAYLTKYMWERYQIRQALISDITWITNGVKEGEGVVVSLRDSGIPRRSYINKITALLTQNDVPWQLEVEGSGGSDGNEIQKQPYPIDWCFIGAAEHNVHSPTEKVHKQDIKSMLQAYQVLMKQL